MYPTLNEISLLADAKMQVDVVYIDFAEAFDSASHNKLLLKVESYDLHSHLFAWIKSFLSNIQISMCLHRCFFVDPSTCH